MLVNMCNLHIASTHKRGREYFHPQRYKPSDAMKNIFVWLFAIVLVSTQGIAQSSKTITQSIPLDGANEVVFNIPAKVELVEWNNDYMRVETTVTLAHLSETILKSIIMSGRYHLDAKNVDGVVTLTSPKSELVVMVGGKEMMDEVSYKVMLPKKTNFVQPLQPKAVPAVGASMPKTF